MNIRIPSGQSIIFDLKTIEGHTSSTTYEITGADSNLFEVTPDGLLKFKDAPNVEQDIDVNNDGIYDVSISAPGIELTSLSIDIVPHSTLLPETPISNDTRVDAVLSGRDDIRIWGDGDSTSDAPLVITWSIAGPNSIFTATQHLGGDDYREYLDDRNTTDAEVSAISQIFQQFSDVANIQFIYVDETEDLNTVGNIRIIFMDQYDTGVAWTPGIYGIDSIDGDITIRLDLRDGLLEDGSNFAKYILAHEIGHAVFTLNDSTPEPGHLNTDLGWEFNNTGWTVSSYLEEQPIYSNSAQDPIGPMVLDIKAIQALFGANPNTGAGESIYQLDENSFTTIYDVSGIDTLNFSTAQDFVHLDLRDETVSKVGLSGLIGIASGTTIENVIGSENDDIFRLNSSTNTIIAGGGNDIIRDAGLDDIINGGEGFDTVFYNFSSTDISLDDLDIAEIEQLVFLDKIINLSNIEAPEDTLNSSSTTYISINASTFNYELWNVEEDDAIAWISTPTAPANSELASPTVTNMNNVTINGAGELFFSSLTQDHNFTVNIDGLPSQEIITSADTNNTYIINLNNSRETIEIYDYDGTDKLILDRFDGWAIANSYVDGNETTIIAESLSGDKSVTITIHNSLSFGYIETLVLRTEEGDKELIITPIDQVFQLGYHRYLNGLDSEFSVDGSYFVPGRIDGAGDYLRVDPLEEYSYQNLDNIDEVLVVWQGGDDYIFGSDGSDQLQGHDGNDYINGGADGDRIFGGFGDDTLIGGQGNDAINADFESDSTATYEDHPGADVIFAGDGDDNVRAGNGNDWVDLGSGNDYHGEVADSGDDTIYGQSGNDTIYGHGGNDLIISGPDDDEVYGEDGNDTITAGDGDDFVRGGRGNDFTNLGAGNDYYDEVESDGNDTINGGAGNDTIYGGEGADMFVFSGDWGSDIIFDFEPGTDIIKLVGTGLQFSDLIITSDGSSYFDIIPDNGNIITIYNEAGIAPSENDFIFTSSENEPIIGSANPETLSGTNASDTLAGMEGNDKLLGNVGDDALYGGAGNDRLIGGTGNDIASGGDGNDQLWAGADDIGNDTVIGGAGNDIVAGGAGNDFLVGGSMNAGNMLQLPENSSQEPSEAGADIIYGGTGNDTLIGGDWNDNAATNNGIYDIGEEITTSTATNTMWAGTGADLLFGAAGSDIMGGGEGDDTISGGNGNDTIYGGSSSDTIGINDIIKGGDGADIIFGGSGNDSIDGDSGDDNLFSGKGSDTINGGAGNDTLWGGRGDDIFTGGNGKDVFIFAAGHGDDTISDFNTTDDELRLINTATDFVSAADVINATTEESGGILIDLGGGDSLFIAGLSQNDINSMDLILS